MIEVVQNAGWDERVIVARCGPLVDLFVVVAERHVVIVDTADGPESGAALLDIARPHLEGRGLLVLNTHSHWDHTWGNQVFAGPGALAPAPILGTRACAAAVRGQAAADFLAGMRSRDAARFGAVRLTPPTVAFDPGGEGLQIDGGDLTLRLIPAPGHADDQVVVFIPEIGTLLAADAAEAPFPFVKSAAELPVQRDTLRRMAALAPSAALYCHAPVTSGPALLADNVAYFDELERRCRAALAAGAPADPPEGADVEQLVGFPFAEAGPAGFATEQPEFYRPGHQTHIRLMLSWCAGGPA